MQVSAEDINDQPEEPKGLLAGFRVDAGLAQRQGWERVRLPVS